MTIRPRILLLIERLGTSRVPANLVGAGGATLRRDTRSRKEGDSGSSDERTRAPIINDQKPSATTRSQRSPTCPVVRHVRRSLLPSPSLLATHTLLLSTHLEETLRYPTMTQHYENASAPTIFSGKCAEGHVRPISRGRATV
eukprot:1185784-Prorocentrum_minimum.AAC.6